MRRFLADCRPAAMKPTSLRRRIVARPTLQWQALERVGMVLRAGSALAAIRQVVTV